MTNLRVLQEGGLMVDAASRPVAEGVLAVDPWAPHHLLLPGFVDAQVGGVNEAAQDQVSEVLTEVIKCHPAGEQEKKRREETRESGYQLEGQGKLEGRKVNRSKIRGNDTKNKRKDYLSKGDKDFWRILGFSQNISSVWGVNHFWRSRSGSVF